MMTNKPTITQEEFDKKVSDRYEFICCNDLMDLATESSIKKDLKVKYDIK